MLLDTPVGMGGIRGYFVEVDRQEVADRFIHHLSPEPLFATSIDDVLLGHPDATTPLVLVISSTDGRILDAHKPIPGELLRRDAFHARWRSILELLGSDAPATSTLHLDVSEIQY